MIAFYFPLEITDWILACMALAQTGCGKFHPTNAPTATQNNVSNIVFLLYYNAGNDWAGPSGRPVVGQAGADAPNVGAGADPNAGGALLKFPGAGWPNVEVLPNDGALLNPPG